MAVDSYSTSDPAPPPDNKPKVLAQGIAALRQDALPSVVVFLVALPLCMGIAIASGVPVAAGLITGIVGGLVVGTLAGCPLQVSGPAAGLTVIVFDVVQRFGFEMLGIVVLMGGFIQLLAGVFGLGQWFRAVSPAVIKGMLAGIGVLIFASQFHVMVDDKPKGNGITNLLTIPAAVSKAIEWPNYASTEKRRARTRAMVEIGELHRRQAAIAERVVERLPDHSTEEELSLETAEQLAAEAGALKMLLPDQQKLTADTERIINSLSEFENRFRKGERSKRVVAACSPAIELSRIASQELSEGHVRNAAKAQADSVAALDDLANALKNHAFAAQIGMLTIAIILLWQAFAPKKVKVLPAPLIAVVIAGGLATAVSMPVLYVEVPDNLWSEIHFPTWAMLTDAPWTALVQSALVVAVVASAETLLCATAVDQMHQGPRTRYNQELTAQGIGNMVCGILGALPMTGVIVRSSANVESGGKTRISAILHGVWLLVFVVFLGFLLRMIPTSALAAILVYTGYKLVNPKSIRELRAYGWGEVAIYSATVVTIVVTDLLTGVIVGITLAAAKLLNAFSQLDVDLAIADGTDKTVLTLTGAATFVRLPTLATKLEQVLPGSELHVDIQHLDHIDHACLDLLTNWSRQHETTGGRLVIDWKSLHSRFRAEKRNPASNSQEANIDKHATPAESGH
ncbi:MAG: SulP family inorganic anion transporter [Planctomycetota bacterium]|nr:SulP family inorganic anion transporter [Planctomycetota bacterium]